MIFLIFLLWHKTCQTYLVFQMMKKIDSRSQTNDSAPLPLNKTRIRGKPTSLPAAQLRPDELVEVVCLKI